MPESYSPNSQGEDKYNILPKALRMGYDFKDLYPNENVEEQDEEYTDIILAADIIFRRPIISQQQVSILDIAKMLKDHKALLDPYYCNHPNVYADWNPYELFSQNCHHLLSNLNTEISFDLKLTKKLCDVFDKIGLPRNAYVNYQDLYSYKWMKKNHSKYGYSFPFLDIRKDKYITAVIDTENCEGGFGNTYLSTMETCPSFIAYILEDNE